LIEYSKYIDFTIVLIKKERDTLQKKFINPETMPPTFGYSHVVEVSNAKRTIDTKNPPARSAVEVRKLINDNFLIEIEAIAVAN